jgi:hypothetical protein
VAVQRFCPSMLPAKSLIHLAHREPSGLPATSPCASETSANRLSTLLTCSHRLRLGKKRLTWTDPSGGWDGKMQEEEERIHSFHTAPTPRFAEKGRTP